MKSIFTKKEIQELTLGLRKELELDRLYHTPPISWFKPNGELITSDGTSTTQVMDRVHWVKESFRWGNSYLTLQNEERFCITLALGINQELTAGIVVEDLPLDSENIARSEHLQKLNQVGEELMEWASSHNLVNDSLMKERHNNAEMERNRAQKIHSFKKNTATDLHRDYENIESELLLAMRKGDRGESIRLLNAILLNLYNSTQERFAEIKELMLELVLAMRRTAIDCGVSEIRIQDSFFIWKEVHSLSNHEDLSVWVKKNLISLIDSVSKSNLPADQLRVNLALNYIRQNSGEIITRPMVASRVGLSEGEFSRLIKRTTGKNFQQHLIDIRIHHAINLLRRSPLNISQIALESGFESSSHFSYAFRKKTGRTPSSYRK